MASTKPPEIAVAGVASGVQRGTSPSAKLFVAGIFGGAFIALGGLFGVTITAGLAPETWGTLPQLFTGMAFSFGLMVIVITGAELVTGGIAFTGIAALTGKLAWSQWLRYLGLTLAGGVAGAVGVAYLLGYQSGILSVEAPSARIAQIAELKTGGSDWEVFLRGIGCNWLVCVAVWMALAADDVGGKLAAIFFPITAFVAMGFDHVVANMFFLPAANFVGADVTWAEILRHWLFAGLGNLVGALVFVAGAYWFLFLRDEPSGAAESAPASAPATAREEREHAHA